MASFLKASHVTRTRRAHEIAASSLYFLLQKAYFDYTSGLEEGHQHMSLEDWCADRRKAYLQFQFWFIILQLELEVMIYVRAIRETGRSFTNLWKQVGHEPLIKDDNNFKYKNVIILFIKGRQKVKLNIPDYDPNISRKPRTALQASASTIDEIITENITMQDLPRVATNVERDVREAISTLRDEESRADCWWVSIKPCKQLEVNS